jgi:hypothetical protein
MTKVKSRIDGVVIGMFLGFDDTHPLVVFPGNQAETAVPARALADLTSDMIGCEVALMFQDGNPKQPLILGRVVTPSRKAANNVIQDGELVQLVANKRMELRCGKASIIMEKDGSITIRGSYVTSHASAKNRIRGGSIDLN